MLVRWAPHHTHQLPSNAYAAAPTLTLYQPPPRCTTETHSTCTKSSKNAFGSWYEGVVPKRTMMSQDRSTAASSMCTRLCCSSTCTPCTRISSSKWKQQQQVEAAAAAGRQCQQKQECGVWICRQGEVLCRSSLCAAALKCGRQHINDLLLISTSSVALQRSHAPVQDGLP